MRIEARQPDERPAHRRSERLERQRSDQALDNDAARSEDIHVRNHDVADQHTVEITVHDSDGRRVFRDRYTLFPGQAESECDALDSDGSYVVEVSCDGIHRETRECRIGKSPEQTALIELGNGVVSVTEGIY